MSLALRIGTRSSTLALAQANSVKDKVAQRVHGIVVEMVPITTSGDKIRTPSLARGGGKGLFIRELEQALSDRRIDVAVHSMKDLPAILPQQFRLAAVPRREEPYDVLLSRSSGGWASLPHGARLGTSSIRRRLQALRARPDLEVMPLRGNVDTRLRRLQAGDFDAIILAAAGLRRLGLARDDRATVILASPLQQLSGGGTEMAPARGGVAGGIGDSARSASDEIAMIELDPRTFVPSGGQGALAVEALCDSPLAGSVEVENAIADLTDLPTLAEITAERAFLAAIGASCVSPVGVNGRADNEILMLRALVFSADGGQSLSGELAEELAAGTSSREQIEHTATQLGERLGRQMLDRGARELIAHE